MADKSADDTLEGIADTIDKYFHDPSHWCWTIAVGRSGTAALRHSIERRRRYLNGSVATRLGIVQADLVASGDGNTAKEIASRLDSLYAAMLDFAHKYDLLVRRNYREISTRGLRTGPSVEDYLRQSNGEADDHAVTKLNAVLEQATDLAGFLRRVEAARKLH